MTKALILAAGFGERLRDVWDGPKGLVKVGGKPILSYILDELEELEFEILIVSNERDNEAYRSLVKLEKREKVEVVNNGVEKKKDSRGAVMDMWLGINKLGTEDGILVLPCDTILRGTLKISELVEYAKYKPGVTLVARKEGKEVIRGRFGNIKVGNEGEVVEFVEKPEEPISELAAAAIYYYPVNELKYIGEYIKEERNNENPGRMIPYLLEKGRKLFAYVVEPGMVDVGTPADLEMVK